MQRIRGNVLTGLSISLLLITGNAQSSAVYQGYDHRVLDHVKSEAATSTANTLKNPVHSEKTYGPESINGLVMPELTVEDINRMPPTASGKRSHLFKSQKDYGIREAVKR